MEYFSLILIRSRFNLRKRANSFPQGRARDRSGIRFYRVELCPVKPYSSG
jgi:hypothetical protein